MTLIGLDLQWILFEHQKRQLTLSEVHLWRDVNMKDANKLIFSPDDLNSLASSISQTGIIQPILVRPNDDFYEIVAGYMLLI